ncbi:MAG: hypothetical protein JSY10_25550 [Paenibacillus sp.]|nr:hypothetical protein [Paenibacillus sp.]
MLPINQKLAYVSSIAFCLSPPAMFMSSFYTESIFALMSFTGMRWAAEKKYLSAAVVWGFTSAVRSNAIVYVGFFFYDLIWIRFIQRKVIKYLLLLYTNLIKKRMEKEFYSRTYKIHFLYIDYILWINFVSILCL